MITCKQDLINTYIENDFGELRDLYVKKAVELGFRLDWLSHSPTGPSNKIVATCHWNGEDYAFTGQTSYLPISTVDMSILRKLTLSDLKPRTKVEYEKSAFKPDEIWKAFKEHQEDGFLFVRTKEGYECLGEGIFNLAMAISQGDQLYRKVERPVEWFDDAVEYLNQNRQSGSCDEQGVLSVGADMTRDQWCDFARILLEQEGE